MTPSLALLALARGVPDTRYRAHVAADGALYHWPLDEGVGNFLPVSGATPYIQPQGTALYRSVDRWGDYACFETSGSNAGTSQSLTLGSPTRVVVQGLCYFPAYGAATGRVLWEYGGAWFNTVGGFALLYDGGNSGASAVAQFAVRDGATLTYGEIPRPPTGWVLITQVIDTTLSGAARVKVYYNGVEQTQSNVTVGANSGTAIANSTLAIGFRSTGATLLAAAGVKFQHVQMYTGSGFTATRMSEHVRHAQAPLVDTRAQQTLLCVGDSITTGYSAWLGYPSKLIGLLRKRGYRKVVTLGTQTGSYDGRETWRKHEGHGGEGTGYFVAHPELLVGCDVAIVMLGTNDVGGSVAYDLSAAQWVANLTTIRNTLVANGCRKVMIVVPFAGTASGGAAPWSAAQLTRRTEYQTASSALADANTVVCTEVADGFNAGTMITPAEKVHPNDTGDAYIAQTIFDKGVTVGWW